MFESIECGSHTNICGVDLLEMDNKFGTHPLRSQIMFFLSYARLQETTNVSLGNRGQGIIAACQNNYNYTYIILYIYNICT